MQHLPLFAPVIVREAVGSVVAHDLGQKESSKGNIHDDAFVNGLGQHLPHKLEQQQMIVLRKTGASQRLPIQVATFTIAMSH